MSLIQGYVASPSFIDAQHSVNGGVVILVEGSMKNPVSMSGSFCYYFCPVS